MEVKVDNENELVSFCGLSFGKFWQFAEFMNFYDRNKNNGMIAELEKELHQSCHWSIDWKNKTFSILGLTWENVFVLNSILILDSNRNCFIWIQRAIEKAVDMAMRRSVP